MGAVSGGYRKSDEVRARLLDTAEELFAERGFYGVSVRDITVRAELRSASVNYHFETKEKLFLAVIDRRIEPLAKLRMERLDDVDVSPGSPEETVRSIADAFAGPMLDLASGGSRGWKNYCILIAHLAVQKMWTDNIVSEKYDVHARKFVEALKQTFPDAEDYRIHCAFQFLLSTTLYAVCDNKRLDTLSQDQYRSADLSRLREPFLDFVSAGIISTAQAPS
ncbi:MAG: TetR/AcrR family transcriptional regulator [Pseudomonadota bacterium]